MGVTFASTIVINDHFEEIGFLREFIVTPRRPEDRVKRVHVLDVKSDLEIFSNRFHRGIYFGKDPVLAFIEEAIPRHNFRKLRQDPPKFNEVAIWGTLPLKRRLDELVQFGIAFFGAREINSSGLGCFLMIFAEASDARRSDALGVTGTERVQQRPIAFIEKENA